jgi:hypothetical protein
MGGCRIQIFDVTHEGLTGVYRRSHFLTHSLQTRILIESLQWIGPMENTQIADLLDEIADLLELSEGDMFRIGAYRNAALTVRGVSRRLEDMVKDGTDLSDLPHIGQSTAEKIKEILRTGTCQRLLGLQKKLPPELPALMKVPQLGARRARLLYDKLKIKSIEELKAACEAHRICRIRTFGEKNGAEYPSRDCHDWRVVRSYVAQAGQRVCRIAGAASGQDEGDHTLGSGRKLPPSTGNHR